MKQPIKLPFGLNESNILVHIADVESGKKCNCVCPDCGSLLIASKGERKQHHFKHVTVNGCEGENAVHRAAKQIIMEKKRITLPKCIVSVSGKDSRGIRHTEERTILEGGKIIKFDSVQEERELHGMRADILAKKDDALLIIEIFYRHKVDDQKIKKIIDANISSIEINLSDLSPEDVKNWEAFWLYLNEPKHIHWLHNARGHSANYPELGKRLAIKIKAQEEQYKEAEKQERKEISRALYNLKAPRSKEYIAYLKQKAETSPIREHLIHDLPFSWNNLPDFVDADIPNGDWIFGRDRRLWQITIYRYFIWFNQETFSIQRVFNWIQSTFNIPPSIKTLISCKFLLLKDAYSDLPSPWGTLRAYLHYLCELGMLEFLSNECELDDPASCKFRVVSKHPQDSATIVQHVAT